MLEPKINEDDSNFGQKIFDFHDVWCLFKEEESLGVDRDNRSDGLSYGGQKSQRFCKEDKQPIAEQR